MTERSYIDAGIEVPPELEAWLKKHFCGSVEGLPLLTESEAKAWIEFGRNRLCLKIAS